MILTDVLLVCILLVLLLNGDWLAKLGVLLTRQWWAAKQRSIKHQIRNRKTRLRQWRARGRRK